MRASADYAVQSFPYDNPQWRRRWEERCLRQTKTMSDASHEKPPPRPPDKERPAPVVRTSNRPLVQTYFKTSADYSRQADKAEAHRAAEALFAPGGVQ